MEERARDGVERRLPLPNIFMSYIKISLHVFLCSVHLSLLHVRGGGFPKRTVCRINKVANQEGNPFHLLLHKKYLVSVKFVSC